MNFVSLLQGSELHHNITAGVILSDQSLVLQNVNRRQAGDFTCLAVNNEGRGTSNPVTLRVRCEYKIFSFLFFFFAVKNICHCNNLF